MRQHLLIIGSVWPEPGSSAAGQRMMQLIALFQSEGWEITFGSAAAKNEHAAGLESLGISKEKLKLNHSSFDRFIKKLHPTVVMFDRFITEEQFGWRVTEHCPGALRILDTEDLHCIRKGRREAVKKGKAFKKIDLLSSDIAKREIASIYRSDLSLIISETEMEILERFFHVDISILQYVPFMLNSIDEETVSNWPSFSERSHFITVGNFRHQPNTDAVFELKNKIWPRIHRQLPEAELHVYGAFPSSKIQALHHSNEGFYIKGRVEDAKAVVRQAKVCLAPLRFGAGLKGKLVEAMQCGTPNVTTQIGAEGLKGDLNWSGIIADDPDEIASAAVRLYRDKERWQQAQQNSVEIVNSRFLKGEHNQLLTNRILELQQNLEQHRIKNFMGSMLMQQTTTASKYMAKWIEEKNKKQNSPGDSK